jgi:hypothetical protein
MNIKPEFSETEQIRALIRFATLLEFPVKKLKKELERAEAKIG